MCGIAGIWSPRLGRHELEAIARSMANALAHRGPDDSGLFTATESGLCLSHRRLSVLDLSPEGHQPMQSACGRYILVYNGEIYNHHALRRELERTGASATWRGHSDTETALAAFAHWGVSGALERFVGMFALALWDEAARTLYLARDRLGEKPLYYGVVDGAFVFASELKALRQHPGWRGTVDRESLSLLLRYGYVPAPLSIYSEVYKLTPGTVLRICEADLADAAGLRTGLHRPRAIPFWSAIEVARRGLSDPYKSSDQQAADELNGVLSTAINGQMVSDVPLGAFLSGGIDSSTVVALMQAQSSKRVRTFTIGFEDEAYNEARYARAVARHLGTDHTELLVTPRDALDVIPRLPQVYDEPFADSSQIPTMLLAELTRTHVTVSLSGDGGDELFGGYNRYFWGPRLWRTIGQLPLGVRSTLAAAITAMRPSWLSRCAKYLRPILPAEARDGNVGDKLHKVAEVLASPDRDAIYEALVCQWRSPSEIVIGHALPDAALQPLQRLASTVPSFEQRMMLADMLTYLPDDILVKLDRAAMSASLESRLPFLDHRVVEFAWRLPLSFKIRGETGKWLLRQVLYRYVPKEIIERPKRGFGVPIDSWLRGPLREWAEDLLNVDRLTADSFFRPDAIQRIWREHLAGQRNWQYRLWPVLMFQSWLAEERSQDFSRRRVSNEDLSRGRKLGSH